MREHGILNINFNVSKDTISIIDSEGTLILHPNKRSNPDDIVHYDFSSEGSNDGLYFNASFLKKKTFKEISPSAINVGEDLHALLNLFEKLPQSPPVRDKAIFSRKENYRKALIEHIKIINQNDSDFQFLEELNVSIFRIEIMKIPNQPK